MDQGAEFEGWSPRIWNSRGPNSAGGVPRRIAAPSGWNFPGEPAWPGSSAAGPLVAAALAMARENNANGNGPPAAEQPFDPNHLLEPGTNLSADTRGVVGEGWLYASDPSGNGTNDQDSGGCPWTATGTFVAFLALPLGLGSPRRRRGKTVAPKPPAASSALLMIWLGVTAASGCDRNAGWLGGVGLGGAEPQGPAVATPADPTESPEPDPSLRAYFRWSDNRTNFNMFGGGVILTGGNAMTCAEVLDLRRRFGDPDGVWIGNSVLRGEDVPWEGEYGPLFLPECREALSAEDPTIRCMQPAGNGTTLKETSGSSPDDRTVIESWSAKEVRGWFTFQGKRHDFLAENCGRYN